MGYTHYWDRENTIEDKKMKAILVDFKKVLPHFESLLASWNGEKGSKAEFNNEISFNGIEDESHESFVFPLVDSGFNFCKTARKPYDIAVTCALIIIKNHLGDKFEVSSDGSIEDEWTDSIKLCSENLGYNVEDIKANLFKEN